MMVNIIQSKCWSNGITRSIRNKRMFSWVWNGSIMLSINNCFSAFSHSHNPKTIASLIFKDYYP